MNLHGRSRAVAREIFSTHAESDRLADLSALVSMTIFALILLNVIAVTLGTVGTTELRTHGDGPWFDNCLSNENRQIAVPISSAVGRVSYHEHVTESNDCSSEVLVPLSSRLKLFLKPVPLQV